MITKLKLKPGQRGTKTLTEQYGDALVCVRYRYDAATRTRIKTVELIVDKKQLSSTKQSHKDKEIVAVQIAYGEKELGNKIRSLGGRWDTDVKLWYIPYGQVKGTELEKHIISDASQKVAVTADASNIR